LGGTGTVGAITSPAGGGSVDPATVASAGTLNAAGNVVFTSQVVYGIELAGTAAGAFDQLNVTGTVDLGGAFLDGALISGFIPAAGDTFTIIQSTGARSGQFSNASPITFNGASFDITYNSNSVVLTALAAAQPDLTVFKTHTGNFARAQVDATYTVTVSNSGIGAVPAANTVSLTETPPAGLTLTGMSGTGWTCVVPTCTRTDSAGPFQDYPPITITVNVANNATSPLVNNVAVTMTATESDVSNNTDADSTIIDPGDVLFADGFE
jgi:uncharacterized repeat protein (TIGR01451 family)